MVTHGAGVVAAASLRHVEDPLQAVGLHRGCDGVELQPFVVHSQILDAALKVATK